MRIHEIITEEVYDGLNHFVTALKTLVGMHAKQGKPASMNWLSVAQIAKKTGFEMLGDTNPENAYETFAMLWDENPRAKGLLEPLVNNFSGKGIELKIPGVSDQEPGDRGSETPQDAVADIAATAAPQQLAQNQQGAKI
jgi:hypothetical protein